MDAWSLIGAGVSKVFHDQDTGALRAFAGSVINVRQDPSSSKRIIFRVQYEDDDSEDVTYEALKPLLTQQSITAASHASVDPVYFTSGALRGFDFPTPLRAVEDIVTQDILHSLAQCARSSAAVAACLLRHASASAPHSVHLVRACQASRAHD